MSVDISVSITEDVVDIIATPTVNIVNVTNSASIDPGLYDLSEFTNTSPNPFVRTSGLSSYVPTSRTLTINGTTQDLSADRTFTISTGITIGTTAITSGTVGRVLFQGTGNVVQQSSSLFWDNTNNRLGVGTSSPARAIDILGSSDTFMYVKSTSTTAETGLIINNDLYYAAFEVFGSLFPNTALRNTSLFATQSGITTMAFATLGAANIAFRTSSNGSNNERLTIFGSTGNVAINTTTDAGFRLDVNGTARVQNTLTITKGAGNFFTFEAAANGSDLSIRFFKTGQLDVSLSTRNAVNVGALQISDGLGLNGGFVATRLAANAGIIAIGNTSGDSLLHVASSSGFSSYVSFREQGAADRGIVGFQNGTSYLQIRTNGATNMSNGTLSTAFFSTGNVGINTTTDAGFRLDVNGTARVQGQLTVQGMQITTAGSTNQDSVVIGKEAHPNSIAFSNVAIGYRSLYVNTGGDNVAIGSFSLRNNTTGTRNTGIGWFALNGNVTGIRNSAIGYNTQSGNFDGSVILGYEAAATASNQFVVGSVGTPAGSVTSEVNTSTQVWNVIINGVPRKILLA